MHAQGIKIRSPEKTQNVKRQKKPDWQRHKMKTDSIHNGNQKISQKEWVRANQSYWKKDCRNNPEKTEWNRVLFVLMKALLSAIIT